MYCTSVSLPPFYGATWEIDLHSVIHIPMSFDFVQLETLVYTQLNGGSPVALVHPPKRTLITSSTGAPAGAAVVIRRLVRVQQKMR